jgi:Domain of unknown function (DUF4129)
METQPIVILLFFATAIFAGSGASSPLGEGSITLLLLGLQWWAMFINYRLRKGMRPRMGSLLHLVGVVIACGLALLTSLNTFDLPMLVVIAGLVIFCWKRGIDKAKAELDDAQLILVFKIGVVILLVMLVPGAFSANGLFQDLSAVLTYALPLFFLSGLIALSFTRVGMIKREHVRQGIPQAASTRGWLVALTFLWGGLIVGALALETFSFSIIQVLLLPLWNILAFIVAWIIYAIVWVLFALYQVLNTLFHFKSVSGKTSTGPAQSTPSISHPLAQTAQFPTWVLLVGRLLLVAIVLLVLFIIFRAILRRARPHIEQESEEEVREALSMRGILRERRQEHKAQTQPKEGALLDMLVPGSARARYRELLQQMAEHGERLGRRPEETPVEYQKRLLALMEEASGEEVSDRKMLTDLTRAYLQERYGETSTDLQEPSENSPWISRMAERLSRGRI